MVSGWTSVRCVSSLRTRTNQERHGPPASSFASNGSGGTRNTSTPSVYRMGRRMGRVPSITRAISCVSRLSMGRDRRRNARPRPAVELRRVLTNVPHPVAMCHGAPQRRNAVFQGVAPEPGETTLGVTSPGIDESRATRTHDSALYSSYEYERVGKLRNCVCVCVKYQ